MPGETIYTKDNELTSFHIILQGQVQSYKQNPVMKQQQVEISQIQRIVNKLDNEAAEYQAMPVLTQALKKTFENLQVQKQSTLELLQVKKQELSEIEPEVEGECYNAGESFGEIPPNYQTSKTYYRGGTCKAVNSVKLIEIRADVFALKVKKIRQDRLAKMAKFLRQIELIKSWKNHDLYSLNDLLELKTFEVPGTVVIQEGKLNDFVVIVQSGTFEVCKQNLSQVYLNEASGLVEIKVPGGESIKSTDLYNQRPRQDQVDRKFYRGS